MSIIFSTFYVDLNIFIHSWNTIFMRKNFIICGITGWCMEIVFTAFKAFRRRELKLNGKTSIWMFPIYGMASIIKPVFRWLKNKTLIIRGLIYTIMIFITEYTTGSFLKKKNMCPWDYSKAKYNINGLIRIDYAPLWFISGLIFEFLLCRIDKKNWNLYKIIII